MAEQHEDTGLTVTGQPAGTVTSCSFSMQTVTQGGYWLDGYWYPYHPQPNYYQPYPLGGGQFNIALPTALDRCAGDVHVFHCEHCKVCRCGKAKLT